MPSRIINLKMSQLLLILIMSLSFNLNAQDIDCMDCHDELSKSNVHFGAVKCQECHTDIVDEDHEDQAVKKVKCIACHDENASKVKIDIHHRLTAKVKNPPSCKTCHGTHNIYSPEKVKNKFETYCSQCHKNGKMKYFYAYHSPVVPNSECLDCHDDEDVHYAEKLSNSKHSTLMCADCHNYIAHNLEEHQDSLAVSHRADCFVCHNNVNQEYSKSIHGISLLEGVDEAAKCWNCHGSHSIQGVESENSLVNAKNIHSTCGKCHDDVAIVAKFGLTVSNPEKQYNQSVHGKVVAEGKDGATCVSCHGGHNISNLTVPLSTINALNIPKTCGQCHQKEQKEYQNSIHWLRVQKGTRYAPVCNDCHSEHGINTVSSRDNNYAEFQQATCIKCHQSTVLNKRTGMEGGEPSEYLDSYHGLATKRGDPDAAFCVDCHSVHSILPASYPESSVNNNNLVNTCRKCHQDAGVTFAQSYSHKTASIRDRNVEDIIEYTYTWLIIFVIGGMIVHNLFIFIKEMSAKRRFNQEQLSVERFNKNEKIQHLLLLISFIVLAITGFALKFPDTFWVRFLKYAGMSEEARQIIHRVSAVIMTLTGFWHIAYLFVSRRGRFQLIQFLPNLKDFRDFTDNMKYYLGLSKKEPEFAYYDYAEKAEYWALIWGTAVMGATGFILWFPTLLGDWAPLWLIKVSEIIHYYEAILASLAILVWHWFFVMFRPSEYPMNFTWLDGDTPMKQFKHHHGYQYKKSLYEINQVLGDNLEKEKTSHFTQLILNRLEKEGIKIEEFLRSEIAQDPGLKDFIEDNE